jgi:hypothetical protein
MRDSDKNPNIYGTRAYQDRVERDKYNVMRGSSQVYTYGGRNFERQYLAEQKRSRAVPSMFPTTPAIRNYPLTPAAPGPNASTPTAAGRRVYTGTGISGPSRQTVQNILAGIAGLIGVCFACAHGVSNGVGLTVTFVCAFVAASLVIRYFKQLAGIAVLAFALYAIVSHFAGH